jgi:hypothetical protein
LDLAKQFLDPYDNENYGKGGEDPLVVDTLIAETNAGSVRWMNGLAEMPLSSVDVQTGNLSAYLLPLRGYSVDEVQQRQENEKMALQERLDLERMLQKSELEAAAKMGQAATTAAATRDTTTLQKAVAAANSSQNNAVKLPPIVDSGRLYGCLAAVVVAVVLVFERSPER